MMLHKIRLLLIVLAALGMVSMGAAQSLSMWSMYLIENINGSLVRVFADGTTRQYDLNLPPNTYVGSRELAFTNDGNRAAVCATVYAGESVTTTLRLLDLTSTQLVEVWQQTLDGGQGCWVNFNETGDLLAISRVYYYAFPGDPGLATMTLPPYALSVVNASDGSPVMMLDPRSAGLDAERAVMLDVRRFVGSEIIAAQVPWGTEFFAVPPAYQVNVNEGTVQEIDRWYHTGFDYLPATGELVWVELDTTRPYAEALGPVSQANVLEYTRADGSLSVIYENSGWLLLDTQFINDGAALAIFELEGIDPETFSPEMMPSNAVRWVALERDGSTRVLFETENAFSQIVSAPGGYAHLYSSPYDGMTPQTTITLEYHVTGQPPLQLWQVESTQGFSWAIAWAQPTTAPTDLPPFPALR